MVREGKTSASLIRDAVRNLDAYLAVCQLGITVSSLGLGALGEPAIATLIKLDGYVPRVESGHRVARVTVREPVENDGNGG